MAKEELNKQIRSFLSSAIKSINKLDYDDAIEDLQAAEMLDKDNPEILYNLGVAYSRKGLHKTAVTFFKKVLNLSFTFADVLTVKKMLSYSLILSNEYDAALEILNKALKLTPNDTTTLNMLGYCFENLERFSDALKIFGKIIEIDNDNINAYNSLGFLMAKTGSDLNKSLIYAKKAYNNNPENAAYLDTLGYVYLKKGEPDMAKKYLKKALEKNPASLEIREHLKELLKL